MQLSEYQPIPTLVTKVTQIDQPRFPVIDAHNHLGDFGDNWVLRPLPELLDEMNASGIKRLVDLDGGWGEAILQEHLKRIKEKAPERFAMYAGVDWSAWPEKGSRFIEWAVGRLREQKAWGAQGLKIWKTLGLRVRDQDGKLVDVDDPRLDPLWAAAAELDLPVTIHVADPVAFFDPVDQHNERWEELHAHPDWQFTSPPFPPFLHIVGGLANVIQRHTKTTFVGAHVGCYAENLNWVGQVLDHCPNFYVDISARIAELGRQPYTSRQFFLKYADRILFGLDMAVNRQEYRLHYRFLETADEYFPYSTAAVPPQGRWSIYGISLPDEVLQKVYYRNAERVIFHQKI